MLLKFFYDWLKVSCDLQAPTKTGTRVTATTGTLATAITVTTVTAIRATAATAATITLDTTTTTATVRSSARAASLRKDALTPASPSLFQISLADTGSRHGVAATPTVTNRIKEANPRRQVGM